METKITKETEKTWKRTMTRTKKIETKDDEDYEPEEPGAAKEVVPAQEFDVKLEWEVSREMAVLMNHQGSING